MSSGFVPGGTIDQPVTRDDEWIQAQKDIEATRIRKDEESRQDEGKTLYDVLQQNKATKQEAFEESIRLKNQFRNLDEDEIEFLDSVLESTRAKEEAVKKETAEQLEIFRRQQEEADKALLREATKSEDTDPLGNSGGLPSSESQWAINARKRKRTKDKEALKGVKLQKSSSGNEPPPAMAKKHQEPEPSATLPKVTGGGVSRSVAAKDKPGEDNNTAKSPVGEKPSTMGLGLAGYSSNEDD